MAERMMQKRCQFCGQSIWTDHGDGTMGRHTSHGAECDRNVIASQTAALAAADKLAEAAGEMDLAYVDYWDGSGPMSFKADRLRSAAGKLSYALADYRRARGGA